MISAMRSKLGPAVIIGVMAVIVVVFIFSGIFTPGSGSQAPSVAGEVNGETISYSEFSRALNQRMEMFRGMLGGKVSESQMEQFHIPEAVFQDLAQKKVLGQIARKEGFYPSMDQIRDQILKIEAFKKDGHFDKMQYKAVLNANQYTPTRFEEVVGQDIMEQNFRDFIGQLAYVGQDEIENELRSMKAKYKVRYVYLDNESVRKMLPKDLKGAEQGVKLNEKVDALSKEILPALSAGGDAKINALLKEVKITVKTSDWISSQSNVIPGVGSVRSIQENLFAMKKEEGAKQFSLMGGTFFAIPQAEEAFDPSKVTAKERNEVQGKLQSQRQQSILSDFMKSYMKSASVSRNDRVVTGKSGGGSAPVTADQ